MSTKTVDWRAFTRVNTPAHPTCDRHANREYQLPSVAGFATRTVSRFASPKTIPVDWFGVITEGVTAWRANTTDRSRRSSRFEFGNPRRTTNGSGRDRGSGHGYPPETQDVGVDSPQSPVAGAQAASATSDGEFIYYIHIRDIKWCKRLEARGAQTGSGWTSAENLCKTRKRGVRPGAGPIYC